MAKKKSNKIGNIELLQENLNFTAAMIEHRDASRCYLVIPIRDKVVSEKKLDANSSLFLLLLTDNEGNIKTGKIAYYTPQDGQKLSTLSPNTFTDIFNDRSISHNGKFRFMDITGGWLYQCEYRDGKKYSFGYVTSKNPDSTSRKTNTEGCTDWYLVTTIVYSNGMTTSWRDYIGTTCDSDPCDEGAYMILCSPDGSTGGSVTKHKTIIEEYYDNEEEAVYTGDSQGDDMNSLIVPDETPTSGGARFETIMVAHPISFGRDGDTGEIDWVEQLPSNWKPQYSYIFWSNGRISTRYIPVTPAGEYKGYSIGGGGLTLTVWWYGPNYGFFTNNWNSNARTEVYSKDFTKTY